MRFVVLAFVVAVGIFSQATVWAQDSMEPNIPFASEQANQPVMAPMTTDPVMSNIAEEHGEKKGLPQFDPETFSKQIFWLLVTFCVMYGVFSKLVLPGFANTLANRHAHVQDLVHQAETMRSKAEVLKLEYEAALDNARAQAKKMLAERMEAERVAQEQAEKIFVDKAHKAQDVLVANLTKQKDAILSDMQTMTVDLASTIGMRVANIQLDKNTLQTVASDLLAQHKQQGNVTQVAA